MALKPIPKTRKTRRKPRFKIYILNFKLQSKSNDLDKNREYIDAFKQLFERNIIIPIKGSKSVTLRSQIESKDSLKNIEYIYGLISKFTSIEGKRWIDLETKKDVYFEIPENLFPDLKETKYVFIPGAHRIAIVSSNEFSLSNAYEYFSKGFEKILGAGTFSVHIEQSTDAFEAILKAYLIKSLYIDISYTNADLSEDATAWMDNELKGGNIGRMKMDLKADSNGHIDPNTTLIKGSLGLAKSNGEAIASIVDTDMKSKKVVTKNHPRREEVVADSQDSINKSIFDKIMSIFRANSKNNNGAD